MLKENHNKKINLCQLHNNLSYIIVRNTTGMAHLEKLLMPVETPSVSKGT